MKAKTRRDGASKSTGPKSTRPKSTGPKSIFDNLDYSLDGSASRKRADLTSVVEWLTERDIKHNKFSCRIEFGGIQIKDSAYTQLRIAFKDEVGQSAGKSLMIDAVEYVADINSYDPLIQYFSNLKWDGVARLDHILTNSLGVIDSDYSQEISKRFFVSAVDRAINPGSQHRLMLILVGEEAIGKSMFCRDICPNPEWFTDYIPRDLHSVRAMEAIQGVFIMESAELVSMRKSEQEAVKAFISRQTDRARMAYKHNPENMQRRCVLIGTTNNDTPIPNDAEWTRYWPVLCKAYERDWLLDNKDQLWAEAYALLKAGYLWWKIDDRLKDIIKTNRDTMRECDAWEEIISELETATYEEWIAAANKQEDGLMDTNIKQSIPVVSHVTGGDSMETTMYKVSKCLEIPTERLGTATQRRIADLLRKYGWINKAVWHGKKAVKVWMKK